MGRLREWKRIRNRLKREVWGFHGLINKGVTIRVDFKVMSNQGRRII